MKALGILIAALLISVVGGFLISHPKILNKGQARAFGQVRACTEGEMYQIANAMFDFGYENYAEFSKLANQPHFVLSRDLAVRIAPYFRDQDLRLRFAGRSGSSRKLLDWWGNEFTMQLRLQPGIEDAVVYEIIITSNGPNGLDELGKGDDLIFGPFELDFK